MYESASSALLRWLVLSFTLITFLFEVSGCVYADRTLSGAEVDAIRGKLKASADGVPRKGVSMSRGLSESRPEMWNVFPTSDDFEVVKNAGFDTVRIPVNLSLHTKREWPYSLDPSFLKLVDQAITRARAQELKIIIDFHHYSFAMKDPEGEYPRFLAIWSQLAKHYAGQPNDLIFEILNEPSHNLTPAIWNRWQSDVLRTIRRLHPDRLIIITPGEWGKVGALSKLTLPDDENLILSIHYYEPMSFTHQGASWIGGSDKWLGTRWGGEKSEEQLREDFRTILKWINSRKIRGVLIGEFGAYEKSEPLSRYRWTNAVRIEAESNEFGWIYWDFDTDFGVYNRSKKGWRQEILKALIP